MEEQTNINDKATNINGIQNTPSEEPKKKRKWFKVNYKKILIPLFAVVIIFYSFLGWKMTRTSNPIVANPKFIFKSIFTSNPAELASNIFNVWDTLHLTDKKIMPAEKFLDLKKLLEETVENQIYFIGLLNSVAIDVNGNSVFNEGTFLMEKNNEFASYDYYIYKNETKAIKTYELDHEAGLAIYKKPQNVDANTIEEYKNFSSAALKALSNINFEELKTKDTKRISISRFMEFNIIQSSDDSLKPIKTIRFNDDGNIIEGQKEKSASQEEPKNQLTTNAPEKTREKMIDSMSDLDNDGLTHEEEVKYGTNPNIPDTDGDGYPDGDEVANGYNPNGSGLLPETTSDTTVRASIFGRNGDDLNEDSVSEIDMLNFAYELGIEVADLEFCDKFRSFRHNFLGACYAGVAISTDDPELCDNAPPQDSISLCYGILAYVNKDISLCENVIEMHRATCFLRAGYGIKDYEICENTELPKNENPYNNFDPLDTCKIGVGLVMKDSSICEEVKTEINEVNKNNCYTRMAVETKDVSLCDKMESPGHCYENVALSRRDISICDKYTDSYHKSNCINPVIAHNPDIKICETLLWNVHKLYCQIKRKFRTMRRYRRYRKKRILPRRSK